MKWRNKYGKQYDEAANRKPYEVKYVLKFAILPVVIHGDTIWLEWYRQKYEWLPTLKIWSNEGKERIKK